METAPLKLLIHYSIDIRTENMKSLQSPGILTVVSIFQLIFIQQNYRAVNFYGNHSQNEVFNEMIQIATDSLKPVTHMEIDAITMNRTTDDEPILNVLIVRDLQLVKKRLMESCLCGTTVIWSTHQIGDLTNAMTSWLKVSSKVIVLTNNDLYTLNSLVETRLRKLSLTNFSLSLANQFLKTFFSIDDVRGSELTIFTQFNAPKSDLTQIDNNYCVIGPDGVLAEAFVKWLKIKPTFSSSVGIKHSNYQDWLHSTILSLRQRYQYYHSAVLTRNKITIFDHNLNSTFDLQLTSFPHQGRRFEQTINVSTEALFPHDIDCLTAIVPQQDLSHDFLRKVIMNVNTIGIGFMLILFILWRLFLQKDIRHQVFVVCFQTISVFLNQSQIPNDNRMKVAWDINLRAFSVLATTTLSAIIFRNLIAAHSNDINTIDDLVKSKLTIYAPDYLKFQEIWPYIRPTLRSKVKFMKENDIESYLVDEQKFNCAYIYFESKAEYIAMIANSKVPMGSRHRVRLMKQRIHCTLASYRIARNSPLTPYVNLFILEVLQNGLYDKQLKWMHDLNEAVFGTKRNEPPKRDTIVLTMRMTIDVFLVYLIGMGMAVICFIVEMLPLRFR